jgi:Fe-S cluster biogenesis protein NfuA
MGKRVVTGPTGWPSGDLESRVRFAIEEVRPALQSDGGDVRLARIENGIVYVELKGACDGCPMAHSTLADFVTERVCLYAPEIEDVVAE